MKCPYCEGQMVPGTASVRGGPLDSTFWSCQHLWFQRDDQVKQPVIDSGEDSPGHQCTQCGAVLIAPPQLS